MRIELQRARGVLTAAELARLVRARGLNVNPSQVAFVLQEETGPAIVHVGEWPDRYRIRRDARTASEPAVQSMDPWREWYLDAVQGLSDVAMDVLRVNVVVGRGEVRARCDVVQGNAAEFRTSLRVRGTAMVAALAGTGAMALPSTGLRLRAMSVNAPPNVAVWVGADPRAAARQMVEIYRDALGLPAHRVELDLVVCPPVEADRRTREQSLLHQLRGGDGARRFAERTCLRCGQPLSDPESVRLGIGPECQKYFSSRFLRAAHSRSQPSMFWFRAKSRETWVKEVRSDLLGNAFNGD